jgi:hypothetical protein
MEVSSVVERRRPPPEEKGHRAEKRTRPTKTDTFRQNFGGLLKFFIHWLYNSIAQSRIVRVDRCLPSKPKDLEHAGRKIPIPNRGYSVTGLKRPHNSLELPIFPQSGGSPIWKASFVRLFARFHWRMEFDPEIFGTRTWPPLVGIGLEHFRCTVFAPIVIRGAH